MPLLRQWFILATLALAAAATTAAIVPRPSLLGEHEINTIEARQLPRPFWIDARSEAEFSQGHIPGAINLNEDNWPQAIAETLAAWNPGQVVIVYCSSSSCTASHAVAARLRGKEYNLGTVHVLHGGWEEWVQNRNSGGDHE